MGDGFQAAKCSLKPIQVEEVAGLVFICFSENPPDFSDAAAALAPQLSPHGLTRAKVIARHRYVVQANWKLLIENNRECYHCRGAHPEFCLSNYDLGLPGDTRAPTVIKKSGGAESPLGTSRPAAAGGQFPRKLLLPHQPSPAPARLRHGNHRRPPRRAPARRASGRKHREPPHHRFPPTFGPTPTAITP